MEIQFTNSHCYQIFFAAVLFQFYVYKSHQFGLGVGKCWQGILGLLWPSRKGSLEVLEV